jgi:hypothetical protein
MCSCQPEDQAEDAAERALKDARRLVGLGDYEPALQKHIWFHDHALEVDPSYYGVRLSFALSDWVELGGKYPKALETLKSIRDQKTSRLLGGETNRELFHDVESINDYLDESKATVMLFEKLAATHSDFASRIYNLADEALIKAGEYALAKRYLGDPKERFTIIKMGFEARWKLATSGQDGTAEARRAFKGIYTDEVVRLITVLDKTGDRALALEIQSNALAVLDSPAIRDAVRN